MKEKVFINKMDLIGNGVLACLLLICCIVLCMGWDWSTFSITMLIFVVMSGLSVWVAKKLDGNVQKVVMKRIGLGFLVFLCFFLVLAKFALAQAARDELKNGNGRPEECARRAVSNAKQAYGFGSAGSTLWASLLSRVAK